VEHAKQLNSVFSQTLLDLVWKSQYCIRRMGSLDSLRKQIEQLVMASEQICAAARRSFTESRDITVQFDNMQRTFLEAKDDAQEQIRQETLHQAEKEGSVSGHLELDAGARTGHKKAP
jgi:hypothetical protein